MPRKITTDNGPQFDSSEFKEFCSSRGIQLCFSAPYHPQSNGQVEVTNKTILDGLKKKLEEIGAKWSDYLEEVFWAYRTTPRTSTQDSLFALVYGMDAVAPSELMLPSHRILTFDEKNNGDNRRMELDLIEERRRKAQINTPHYQMLMRSRYAARVKWREFKPGYLVLRKILQHNKDISLGKLGPNWEGSFLVIEKVNSGTYMLKNREGIQLRLP